MKRLLLACTLLLLTGTAFAQEEGDDVIYTDSTITVLLTPQEK